MAVIVDRLDAVTARLADLADNPKIDYHSFVIASGWLQTLFEVYLLRRQIRCYDRPAPPSELAEHLEKDTFDKAQRYGRDKARYLLAQNVFNQFLSYGMLKAGVYPYLWSFSGHIMDSVGLSQSRTISQSLIWVFSLLAISTIPSIPWDYYYTFVIEERHGFNKSTRKLWVMDQLKTWILAPVLGGPIIAGFLWIIDWAGKRFVPWLMLFVVVVQFGMQLIYPIFIQPLFNKLDPLPQGEVRERVEKMAGELGFPLKHLYVIDGSKRSGHSNAYFYGLPWSKHIVIYDTLLEKSSPSEVEAVLGHELGHWFYTHPTKLLGVVQTSLLFTLTLFAAFIHNKALFSSFGFDPRLATRNPAGGPQPIIIGFWLYQLVSSPLDAFVGFALKLVTRKYEYQADEFAIKMDKKDDLAKALIRLHVDNLSSPHNDKFYSMYHHSHPTLPERLKAMEVFDAQRASKTGAKIEGKKDL